MSSVYRLIHYYNIIHRNTANQRDHLIADKGKSLFGHMSHYNSRRLADRKQWTNQATYHTTDLTFLPSDNCFRGKFVKIRTDIAPQTIDLHEDTIEDLIVEGNKGFVEITHFLISFRNGRTCIALEYNHYAGRITEFIRYLCYFKELIVDLKPLNLDIELIVNEALNSYIDRLGKVSNVYASVKKNDVERINDIDNELFGGAHYAQNASPYEYVAITHKINIRTLRKQEPNSDGLKRIVTPIVRAFIREPELVASFEAFKVTGEDRFGGSQLEVFDLIMDKVRSVVKVDRKPHSKVLVSSSMYEQLLMATIANNL